MRDLLAIVLLSVLLCGCTLVRSDVTRFDQLPQDIAGKSVYFLPLEGQATSAAYLSYSSRIAAELAKYGIVRADDVETADYALMMAYGLGGRRQISSALPLYGQTGGGSTYHSGTVSAYGAGVRSSGSYSGHSYSPPTYGMVGMMPFTQTEFDRFLTIRMIDLQRSTAEKIVPVYEGKVVSTGKLSSFDQVAGCMIQALFEDFRQSGSDRVHLVTSTCQ